MSYIDELYQKYDEAMDKGDIIKASKVHEIITAIDNVTEDVEVPISLNKGVVVGVYENELIGWIPVRLKRFIGETNGNQRWLVSTFCGDKLIRTILFNSKDRYSFICPSGLDLYVWDNVLRKTVGAATFEQEYWIKFNGDFKFFSEPKNWSLAVKEYFGLN